MMVAFLKLQVYLAVELFPSPLAFGEFTWKRNDTDDNVRGGQSIYITILVNNSEEVGTVRLFECCLHAAEKYNLFA